MLHTLSSSPWKCDINEMLRIIKIGDDLLLIQDGVLGAIEGSRFVEQLIDASVTVFALKEDVYARGIFSRISDEIKVVDYAYFVLLVVKHSTQMSW